MVHLVFGDLLYSISSSPTKEIIVYVAGLILYITLLFQFFLGIFYLAKKGN